MRWKARNERVLRSRIEHLRSAGERNQTTVDLVRLSLDRDTPADVRDEAKKIVAWMVRQATPST